MDLQELFSAFHTLGNDNYSLLQSKLQSKLFKRGEMILREGEVQKKLFFVHKGLMMSYVLHHDKTHVVAFVYAPGIGAAPESFFAQKPSTCFIECLTEVECAFISWTDLQELFNRSQDIERVFRKMTESILAGLIHRYNELQTLSIEERFRSFTKRSPHLLQMVPHKYIASYLHINPTNFSKLYNSIRL